MLNRRAFVAGCVAAGAGAALPVVKTGCDCASVAPEVKVAISGVPERPAIGDLLFRRGEHWVTYHRGGGFTDLDVRDNDYLIYHHHTVAQFTGRVVG